MAMDKETKIRALLQPERPFRKEGGTLFFLPEQTGQRPSAGSGLQARIQDVLKKSPSLYYLLLDLLAPVHPGRQYRRRMKRLIADHPPEGVALNLGGGPRVLAGRSDVINVDLFPFEPVDMAADAADLPFRDDTVDLVISTALLEHVPDPDAVAAEIHRVLKPGGVIFCYLPFMQPFHAAPGDYYRWTVPGVRRLFHLFPDPEIGPGAGPTSAMLWIFLEWFSALFSFGSHTLRDIVFLVAMPLVAPFKLLDEIMEGWPSAQRAASGHYVLATKGRPVESTGLDK